MTTWRLRWAVVLACSAVLACGPAARAGAVFFAGKLAGGEFIPDPAHKGPCYTVRYSAITARIDGASAETKIAETIAGPTGGTVKAVCVIPLPAGADGKAWSLSIFKPKELGMGLDDTEIYLGKDLAPYFAEKPEWAIKFGKRKHP